MKKIKVENECVSRAIKLLERYNKLNEIGKGKVDEYICDVLLKIDDYTCEILPIVTKDEKIIHIDFGKAI